MKSTEILEREFLEIRGKILELAASLDRIDRADGDVSDETKMVGIRTGIEILTEFDSDRAKRIQLLFSREYQENWAHEFQIQPRL